MEEWQLGGLRFRKPYSLLSGDHETAWQPMRMTQQQPPKRGDFHDRPFILETQKHDAMVQLALAIDLLSKPFVVGDQNPLFSESFFDDLIVVHSAGFIIDRKDVVPLLTQPMRHVGTGAFIH